jgi:cytochrome c
VALDEATYDVRRLIKPSELRENRMKKAIMAFVAILMACSMNVLAETATPEEIYEHVLAGVELLQGLGAEGLPAFNDPEGELVWKDTYVQVYNCEAQKIVGHVNPALLAWTTEKFATIKDKKDNPITKLICDASKKTHGDWVEYWWPKSGETRASRKITFVIQVPGFPYQVSSGIYDDNMSLDQLRAINN